MGRSDVRFRDQVLHAAKGYTRETHRLSSPADTFHRIEPYLKTAGVTRLADITGLDRIGIPVFQALRPNAPTMSSTSGKGATTDAAKVSACMEAIEIYRAETMSPPVIRASYRQIAAQHPVIAVEDLPLAKNSSFNPAYAEDWVLGWDLIAQQEAAVPLALVHLGREQYSPTPSLTAYQMGSNGLASGNNLLEAILAGLYEVIERDAIACRTLAAGTGALPYTRVRLQTIESPIARGLIDKIEAAGVSLILHDCRVDTDVPVFSAAVYDRLAERAGSFGGAGAHLEPEVAMIRAITEAVQSRGVIMAGARDDLFRHDRWINQLDSDALRLRQAAEAVPATLDAGTIRSEATPTFDGDLELLLAKLQRAGLRQVIVFDLGQPAFDVGIARVVVPGLEGYLFRYYTPGRRAQRYMTVPSSPPTSQASA